MGNTGLLFPIFLAFFLLMAVILGLLDKMLQPKDSYEKWLGEELKRNPGYIDWLMANDGKGYKMGLRIVKRLRRKGEMR